jgi:GT2 family glycosyltransferase
MTVCVSVIVPTRCRAALLERALFALLAQDFPARDVEVLVADDGSDPPTRTIVEAARREAQRRSGPTVRYLPASEARGPAAARNRACREARGAIFAFTDDDTIPDPGWLRAGVAAIGASADAAAGCIEVPLPDRRPTDYERDTAQLQIAEFATANCFVKADVFWNVGGFDERFATAWREDSDLQFRLLDAGFTIASAPDALVIHPVRAAPWGISLRQQRKSHYNALLYKKHPRRYRRHIQSRPPTAYYVSVGTLISSVCLLRRNRALATGSFLAWLLLTMRFALHRLNGTALTGSHIAEMAATSALIPPLGIFWRLKGAAKFKVVFI